RRDGARRPGGTVAAVVRTVVRTADAAPRLAWVRGGRAERPRLDRLRQALRTARRHPKAARLGSRPRLATRVAERAPRDRRLARGRLRPLLRRPHGARRPRVPARALGCGA